MKLCSKCGMPLNDDVIFCSNCGTKYTELNDIQNTLIKKDISKKLSTVSILWLILGIVYILVFICKVLTFVSHCIIYENIGITDILYMLLYRMIPYALNIILAVMCIKFSVKAKDGKSTINQNKYLSFNKLLGVAYTFLFIYDLYEILRGRWYIWPYLINSFVILFLTAIIVTIINLIIRLRANTKIKKYKELFATEVNHKHHSTQQSTEQIEKIIKHSCSQCGHTFNVKYKTSENQGKTLTLSVLCPKCKVKEIIKTNNGKV